mgnify:FL=1
MIEDDRRRLLLELRPAQERHAANLLTCFGGARENDETMDAALRRELREELDWTLGASTPCCDLRCHDGRWIARFFRCPWRPAPLRTEPGVVPIWAPWSAMPALPLSPWHGVVLLAMLDGRTEAVV